MSNGNWFTACPWNMMYRVKSSGQWAFLQPSGSILVLVLVTLLLFSTVVLQVTQHAAQVNENQILLAQSAEAGLQAEAALEKALELIAQAAANPGEEGDSSAALNWEEDTIRITVMPTNAKLNLNALHPPSLHPQAMQRLHAGLNRILRNHEVEGDVQEILLWLGQGFDPDKPGSERTADARYTGMQPEYRPRKGALQRPEELLLVHGFNGLDPDWVRERFTVWGQDGRVNLNIVGPDVLLALAPELEAYWPAIERHRGEHGFQRMDELISRIRLPMDIYQKVLPHIALDSDYLEISVEVRQPAWYERQRVIVEHPAILSETPPRIVARDVVESRPLVD